MCLVRIRSTDFQLTADPFSFLFLGWENIFSIPLVFTNYLLSLIYQNDKEMKKTVKYNGENIKVDFVKINNNDRIIDEEQTFSDYRKITKAHGTYGFEINGKVYQVKWTMNFAQTASVQHHFEGFTCGDSEKKMIEHIISKHGL